MPEFFNINYWNRWRKSWNWRKKSWRKKPPSKPVSLFRKDHNFPTALLAKLSNLSSSNKRERIPNSTSNEPAPAVQVSFIVSSFTPVNKFTRGNGKPDDVLHENEIDVNYYSEKSTKN